MNEWHWSKSRDPLAVVEKMAATKRQRNAEIAAAKGFKEDRKCENCGNLFARKIRGRGSAPESWPAYNKRRFCSKSCQAQFRERSAGRSAIIKQCEHCGKEYSAKGTLRKLDARFCSVSCKNSVLFSGDGHWNWKGGVTEEHALLRHSQEYDDWRFSVYARDHYRCQRCGIKCRSKTGAENRPDDIVAHHIKPFNEFPELRFDVDNGETLCRSCHKKEHYDIGEDTRFDNSTANQPLPEGHRLAIAKAQQRIAAEYAKANGFAEDRKCQHCGEIFPRNRFENGRIEDWLTYNKRKFCSRSCRNNARWSASTPDERSAAYAEASGFKEDRHCEHCGQHFGRQCGGEKGTILPWHQYLKKKYCTSKCAAIAREAAKSATHN